jgi:hypothetical protein
MMGFMNNLVAWCKKERQQMQKEVEGMKSGKAKHSTMSGTGWFDTTPGDIALYEQKIAELDALIARHPEAK